MKILLKIISKNIACFIAFAMGTSWETIAIGIPIAIPLDLATGIPLPIITSTVLTGAIFGNHCSPISDTTVMSSMFSGSDHMDHVTTQIPYALLAAVAAVMGYAVLAISGFNYWFWLVSWGISFVLLLVAVRILSDHSAKKMVSNPPGDSGKA